MLICCFLLGKIVIDATCNYIQYKPNVFWGLFVTGLETMAKWDSQSIFLIYSQMQMNLLFILCINWQWNFSILVPLNPRFGNEYRRSSINSLCQQKILVAQVASFDIKKSQYSESSVLDYWQMDSMKYMCICLLLWLLYYDRWNGNWLACLFGISVNNIWFCLIL